MGGGWELLFTQELLTYSVQTLVAQGVSVGLTGHILEALLRQGELKE